MNDHAEIECPCGATLTFPLTGPKGEVVSCGSCDRQLSRLSKDRGVWLDPLPVGVETSHSAVRKDKPPE